MVRVLLVLTVAITMAACASATDAESPPLGPLYVLERVNEQVPPGVISRDPFRTIELVSSEIRFEAQRYRTTTIVRTTTSEGTKTDTLQAGGSFEVSGTKIVFRLEGGSLGTGEILNSSTLTMLTSFGAILRYVQPMVVQLH